ncbi:hypothetical protein [Streptosporangium sp. NBC_01756]|nr:hypothetical protein [Streptosporangium sp. NBC_01756]WSC90257.1 hypothetical protein OIE48_19375 [Streptosporangium sp. NBC_01756]
MGDEEARGEFFGAGCRICSDTRIWSDVRRNPPALQVPGASP